MHGLMSLAVRTCLIAVLSLVLVPYPHYVEAGRTGAASLRVTFILQLASGAVKALAPGAEFDGELRAVPVSTTVDASTVVLQTDPSHVTVTRWAGGPEFDQVLLPGTDLGRGRFRLDVGRTQGPWPSSSVLVARFTIRVGLSVPTSTMVSLVSPGPVRTRVASDQHEVAYGVVALELGAPISPGAPPATTAPTPVVIAPAPIPVAAAPRPAPPLVCGTVSPMGLPALAPSPRVPAWSDAIGSIPLGFEPGARPVGMAFSGFYAAREGMRLLGRPMGDAFGNGQGGIAVQYFETGRLEFHPEEPCPDWQFLLGLLASELIDRGIELLVGGDSSSITYADLARLRVARLRIPPPEGFGG